MNSQIPGGLYQDVKYTLKSILVYEYISELNFDWLVQGI